MSMVVVMPDFEEGDDYRTMLDSLVADVENKYSVIEDAHYRAILGVNVGGYMAYETALISESETFFAVGSHMGDFTSENNPYLQNGAVLDVVNSLGRGSDLIETHYYYLDAPNGDSFSTVEGGERPILEPVWRKGQILTMGQRMLWPAHRILVRWSMRC